MKTRAKYYFLIFFFFTAVIHPQTVTVSGTVYGDPVGQRLDSVTVKIIDPSTNDLLDSVITDSQGNYSAEFIVTAVSSDALYPKSYKLSNAYPNPFNPSTNINFATPVNGRFRVELYNILGERLFGKGYELEKGEHRFYISGLGTAGVYFFRISNKEISKTAKLMLLDGGGRSYTEVKLFSGGRSSSGLGKIANMDTVVVIFSKEGFATQDTTVEVTENIVLNGSLSQYSTTRTAMLNIKAIDTKTSEPLTGADILIVRSDNDSTMAEGKTDTTGEGSFEFTYIGYEGDTEGIYNNIGNIKIILNKENYATEEKQIAFRTEMVATVAMQRNYYEVKATLYLYETDGDVVSIDKQPRMSYVWNEDTTTVTTANGKIEINASYKGVTPDTNIIILPPDSLEYLGTMAMTTVDTNKVVNIAQSQNQLSGLEISFETLNELKETELYFIPKVVYYGENGDISAEMDGDLVVNFYKDRESFYFLGATGHRATDEYPTTVILKGTFYEDTGEQISQADIDRRDREIDVYLDATHLPHKNLLNYETKTFTSFQDTIYTNLRSLPRAKENIALAIFSDIDGNYIEYDTKDTPLKFRIFYSTTSTRPTNGGAGVMSEFFGSMTNTEAALGGYVTTPSTGGDITDLGQNIIGITYLFKPHSCFWLTEGISYPTQTISNDTSISVSSRTSVEELLNKYTSTSTGFDINEGK